MLCVKLAGTTPYALLREGEIRLSLVRVIRTAPTSSYHVHGAVGS